MIRKKTAKCLALAALVCVMAATPHTLLAQLRKVHVSSAKIQSKPKSLSKTLLKPRIGSMVTVVEEGDKWTKVRVGSVTGWIKNGYLEPKRKGLFVNTGNTTAEERSTAGRGYNPEVEGKYKTKNPNLVPFYAKLDAIERDSIHKVDDSQADAFLTQGSVSPRE